MCLSQMGEPNKLKSTQNVFGCEILKGLREQLTADGMSHLMNLEHNNNHIEQYHDMCMDDISGKMLDP